jgi:RNA polymerase sigma factor (sigma-70 family)
MRDQQLRPASSELSREELFTQRYADLKAWAVRITGDPDKAHDLVHDAYIQFVLGRTSLEEIENLDGYLRRMLRYMYLSKMHRNSQKFFDQTLSIADYDSFHHTWRSLQPPDRMQAQEELSQICAYACQRKETSRAGSVFILRFFHDYLPTEIATVLCTSRHCVDQWQRLARKEVKSYLTKPAKLRIVNPRTRAQIRMPETKLSGVDCDVVSELREIVFSSRQGACLSDEELNRIYKEDSDALTTPKLAHIVSCRDCLDRVNRLVGLPSLAERYQPEPKDPDDPPAPPGTNAAERTSYRRRLQEVQEHKPEKLRIAVNGSLLGSFKINSDRSELDLNLMQDPINFVEVFSEQGLQLMFLSLSEAVRSQPEQWARIELSDDRSLEVVVSLKTEPTLHLTYIEPPASEPVSTFAPLEIVKNESLVEAIATPPSSTLNPILTFKQFIRPTFQKRVWSPGLITAIASVLIIAAYVLLTTRTVPVSTESGLLDRASLAEDSATLATEIVVHRMINLEERVAGRAVSRKVIESWRQSDQRVRRLFDDRNNPIAAVCEKGDGSTTIYHHGSRPQTNGASALPGNLDEIWRLDLAAKEIRTLINGHEKKFQVEETSRSYILTYNVDLKLGSINIRKVELILDRATLHAIEQTLTIDNADEIRAYRFVETSYQQLPRNSVNPKVFEVEPEMSNEAPPVEHRYLNSAPETTANIHPSVMASTELEVDIAYLLNRAIGERNEQVSLSRTPDNLLLVEGVVESDERKLELLRILDPVRRNPAVQIELHSVAESSPSAPGRIVSRDAEETANTIAVYSELHRYFSNNNASKSGEDLVDNSIRAFSTKTVNRAYRILFQAIELRRLADRFANVDMRSITPDARSKWLQMIQDHGRAIERDTLALHQDLAPIFLSNDNSPAPGHVEIGDDRQLVSAIESLYALAVTTNEAVREAFAISPKTSSVAFKSTEFWRSLRSSEKLAASIKRYDGL